MSVINLVVIGYGGMGSYHARELIQEKEGVKVIGVYDIDQTRLDLAKENNFTVYPTLESVLEDKTVEAVLIATPNDSHKELAIKAIKAGKHVVCEKPVMMNTAELEEVMVTAKVEDKIFMVHQNRRWDNDFLIIRDLYKEKQVGELFQIESRVQGANGIPGDWRHLKQHGGGMLLDWGVHLLDQMLFMVDSPLKTVACDLSFVLGDEVDDGFISYLTFENGVKAVVEVGTTNFVKLPRWYVRGFEGAAVIKDWDLSGEIVKQTGTIDHHNLVPIQAGQGLTKTMAPPSEDATTTLDIKEVAADFDSFYHNFYDVVRNNAEPIVKNEEVYRVLCLIETMFEAAEKKEILTFE
ncbi:Gfo/Idh/MocA family protein [Vagococcus hydrophili]|uniref:Gfo/Idh/MocA family oxidoreductase n=1 Tax=Vagococcus hydrophili TaxID=2714947 RepID=A0A6G8ARL6_9ENTE|nr:Gfo/Idh/MocA family oxidoreductase [Vagococcus hydrophili]QIL47582.1 Gfo/Idh/MocA family oxidoreductase [Vagococcus hydrophili]